MVRQESANQDLSEASIDLSGLDAIYEAVIDSSLNTGASRLVTLHLQPILSVPSGTVPLDAPFNYNPFFGESNRSAPVEKSPGVHKERRIVQYRASILHGPTDIDSEGPLGRVADNEVQIKTVIGSEKHIRDAVSIEVDGRFFKLLRGPRPIGWRQAKYLISIWSESQMISDGAK